MKLCQSFLYFFLQTLHMRFLYTLAGESERRAEVAFGGAALSSPLVYFLSTEFLVVLIL